MQKWDATGLSAGGGAVEANTPFTGEETFFDGHL